jgi:hypothetical protein
MRISIFFKMIAGLFHPAQSYQIHPAELTATPQKSRSKLDLAAPGSMG